MGTPSFLIQHPTENRFLILENIYSGLAHKYDKKEKEIKIFEQGIEEYITDEKLLSIWQEYLIWETQNPQFEAPTRWLAQPDKSTKLDDLNKHLKWFLEIKENINKFTLIYDSLKKKLKSLNVPFPKKYTYNDSLQKIKTLERQLHYVLTENRNPYSKIETVLNVLLKNPSDFRVVNLDKFKDENETKSYVIYFAENDAYHLSGYLNSQKGVGTLKSAKTFSTPELAVKHINIVYNRDTPNYYVIEVELEFKKIVLDKNNHKKIPELLAALNSAKQEKDLKEQTRTASAKLQEEKLLKENKTLKDLLNQHGILIPEIEPVIIKKKLL